MGSSKTGKATAPAKVFTCCEFVSCQDKSFDLVAGGSNGTIFLWKKGALTASAQVLRGRITVVALSVGQDRLFVGGIGGQLKVIDSRTLATTASFDLLGSGPSPSKGSGRPASAGRPRTAGACSSSLSLLPGGSERGGGGGGQRRPVSASRPRTAQQIGQPITALARPTRGGKSVDPASHGQAAGLSTQRREERDNPNPNNGSSTTEGEEGGGSRLVTGITVVAGSGRNGAGSYLLVSLGVGKVVRVDIGTGGNTGSDTGSHDLLFFHTGAVYGLAADVSSSARLFCTVGDDKKLMIWDSADRVLIGKTTLKVRLFLFLFLVLLFSSLLLITSLLITEPLSLLSFGQNQFFRRRRIQCRHFDRLFPDGFHGKGRTLLSSG
jgi:hypothetical protein